MYRRYTIRSLQAASTAAKASPSLSASKKTKTANMCFVRKSLVFLLACHRLTCLYVYVSHEDLIYKLPNTGNGLQL